MTITKLDDRDPNVMFSGWLQVRRRLFACAPPKCGSQSLQRAAFGVNGLGRVFKARDERLRAGDFDIGAFTPWQVENFEGRKILGVREPVDRFSALWRDKCLSTSKTHHRIKDRVGGMTPDELIALIEQFPLGDSHWFPQAAYLVPGVELVPHDRLLRVLGLDEIRINARPGNVPALPAERVRAHYVRDVELYRAAIESSKP